MNGIGFTSPLVYNATMGICTAPDCEQLAKYKDHCGMHHMRLKRYGSYVVSVREKVIRLCSVEGCTAKHLANGYCNKHMLRMKSHGTTEALRPYEQHGMEQTPEYATWLHIIQRTTNPNNKDYPYYGARGIKVSDRWRESFSNFYADMGPRPEGLTIERVNNDGNYEAGNCIWASRLVQRHNRRDSIKNKDNS